MANHEQLTDLDLHLPARQQIVNGTGVQLSVGDFVKLDVRTTSTTVDNVTRQVKTVINLAVADDVIVGYVDRNIAPGNSGAVVTLDKFDYNTSAFNVGDFLGLILPTGETKVQLSTAGVDKVARVTIKGAAGEGEVIFNSLGASTPGIDIRLQNLIDVGITDPLQSQIITYDSTFTNPDYPFFVGGWVNNDNEALSITDFITATYTNPIHDFTASATLAPTDSSIPAQTSNQDITAVAAFQVGTVTAEGTPQLIEVDGTVTPNVVKVLAPAEISVPTPIAGTIIATFTSNLTAGDIGVIIDLIAIRTSGNVIIDTQEAVPTVVNNVSIGLNVTGNIKTLFSGDFLKDDVIGWRVRLINNSTTNTYTLSATSPGNWNASTASNTVINAFHRSQLLLEELADTRLLEAANGDLVKRNSATQQWDNAALEVSTPSGSETRVDLLNVDTTTNANSIIINNPIPSTTSITSGEAGVLYRSTGSAPVHTVWRNLSVTGDGDGTNTGNIVVTPGISGTAVSRAISSKIPDVDATVILPNNEVYGLVRSSVSPNALSWTQTFNPQNLYDLLDVDANLDGTVTTRTLKDHDTLRWSTSFINPDMSTGAWIREDIKTLTNATDAIGEHATFVVESTSTDITTQIRGLRSSSGGLSISAPILGAQDVRIENTGVHSIANLPSGTPDSNTGTLVVNGSDDIVDVRRIKGTTNTNSNTPITVAESTDTNYIDLTLTADLNDIQDVNVPNPEDKHYLIYNKALELWESSSNILFNVTGSIEGLITRPQTAFPLTVIPESSGFPDFNPGIGLGAVSLITLTNVSADTTNGAIAIDSNNNQVIVTRNSLLDVVIPTTGSISSVSVVGTPFSTNLHFRIILYAVRSGVNIPLVTSNTIQTNNGTGGAWSVPITSFTSPLRANFLANDRIAFGYEVLNNNIFSIVVNSTIPGGWSASAITGAIDIEADGILGLNELSDVSDTVTSTASTGQLLRFDGIRWSNGTIAYGNNLTATTVDSTVTVNSDLPDATQLTPNVFYGLDNNSGTLSWLEAEMNRLTDVNITLPLENGDILERQGSFFVNVPNNSKAITGNITGTLSKINQEFTFGITLGFGVGNVTATVPYTGTTASGTPNGLLEYASGTGNLTVLEDAQVTIPVLETDNFFHIGVTVAPAIGDLRFSLEMIAIRSSGEVVVATTPEVGNVDSDLTPQVRRTDFPSTLTGDFQANDVIGVRIRVRNSALITYTGIASGNIGGWQAATGTHTVTAIRRTSIDLNEINNVTVPSPSAGDRLSYNGTNWINDARADAFIAANTTSADIASTGDIPSGIYTPNIAIEYDPTGNWSVVGNSYMTGKRGTFEISIECEIYGNRNPPADITISGTTFSPANTHTNPIVRIERRNANGELYPDGRDNFLNTVLRRPDVRDVTTAKFNYDIGATLVKVSGTFFMYQGDRFNFAIEQVDGLAVSIRRVIGEVTELS